MEYDWKQFYKWLCTVPVIESHEHHTGLTQPYEDIFELIIDNYLDTDMLVANEGIPAKDTISKYESFEDKCKAFISIFDKTKFTCYSQAARNAFLMCYDADILTLDGLGKIKAMQPQRTQSFHDALIKNAGIKAAICDLYMLDVADYDNDRFYAGWCRLSINTPRWHKITCYGDMKAVNEHSFGAKKITCLDDYIGAMNKCVSKCKKSGRFYTLKNQSAYTRDLDYKNPTNAEAQFVFDMLIRDKKRVLAPTDARLLDDYIFHRIADACEKYDMPLQIHTGHLADGFQDVSKANASKLTEFISLHPGTVFDLFHGNYPYMGEFLFLGKNYPNVMMDLCWLHSIDTDYSIELMRRMVLTCPTTKVLAFGGDTFKVESQVAYLDQARKAVAKALCSLIDDELMDLPEAKRIAADWMYNNPNRIYKLGLEPYEVK